MAVQQLQIEVPGDGSHVAILSGVPANVHECVLKNTGTNDLFIGPDLYLASPSNVVATPVDSGGTFDAGTYYWVVTALNSYGETTGSAEVSASIALNGSCDLTWDAVTGATGYNVYRSTTSGGETSSPALVNDISHPPTLLAEGESPMGDPLNVTNYTDVGDPDSPFDGAAPSVNTAAIGVIYPFPAHAVIGFSITPSTVLMARGDSGGEVTGLLIG